MLSLFRHPDVRAHALLFAFLCLFLWPAVGGGKALFPADILYTFHPWKALAVEAGFTVAHNDLIADQVLQDYGWKSLVRESLQRGQLPLWNPAILTGVPFLAAGQPAVLYPPTWVFFGLLPVAQAYGWFALVHLFAAGSGCYWLLRSFGAGRSAAWLSGMTFALSGVMAVSLQWPQVIGVYVWLPWIILAVEGIARNAAAGLPRRALAWAMGGSAALCLAWLGGHAEIAIYGNVLAAAFGTVRCGLVARRTGRSAAVTAGLGVLLMLGLGAGLAAVQLLPEIIAVSGNFREGAASYQDVVGWALPKIQLLAFLVPDVFGNPAHHSYFDLFKGVWQPVAGSTDLAGEARTYPFWGAKNYAEGTAYIGVLPLALAVAAVALRRDGTIRFFAGFALVCLLFAFGTAAYALMFNLPGFNQLHSPFRWLYPYAFCGAVLAGLSFDAIVARVQPGRSGSTMAAGAKRLGIALLVAGAGLMAALLASWMMASASLEWMQWARSRSQALAAAFPNPEMLYSYEMRNLGWFALLLLLGGLAFVLLRRSRRVFTGVVLVVVVADLVSFGGGFVTFGDAGVLNARPRALEWLRAQPEPFRIAAAGSGDLLPPNSSALAGVDDIRGYESIIPRAYVEFWKLMEPPVDLSYNRLNHFREPAALDLRLLGLMNVRYVLAADPIPGNTMALVYQDGMLIYENPHWMPRAYSVYRALAVPDDAAARSIVASPGFDARSAVVLEGAVPLPGTAANPGMGPARIVARTANSVTVSAELVQDGYLVLAEAYDQGWQAKDEAGQTLPVLRANGIFRAVKLEAGAHTVRFAYFPDSLKLGLYLSFLAGAVWLLLLGAVMWPRVVARRELSLAQRVAKNSMAPMMAQLLARTVDFGFSVFMLRLLGPADYGGYSFAVALIGYFAIFTDYGLGTLLTRDAAKAPERAQRLVGEVIGLRLLLCLISFPVLAAVSWWYHQQFGLALDAVAAALLFMVSLLPSGLAGALSARFSAQESMEYPAAVSVGAAVLRASLGLGALILGGGVVGLGVVSVVASSMNALLFWWLYARRHGRPRITLDLAAGLFLLRSSAPLMFNSFLNTIFFRIDILLLQAMRGAETVGLYSTAYKFIDGLLVIPTFLTLALFPLLSRFADESRERLLATYGRAVKALVLVAVPVAAGFTFLAEDVLRFFFGEAYAPAALALRLLVWFLPLSYVNGVTQYLLIAVNQQRLITGAFVLGASFNVVGNLVVIPRFGMEGSAVVTVLSEVVLMAPFMAGVRAHVGALPVSFGLARGVAASLVMVVGLWAMRGAPGPVFVIAGVVVYGLALVVLRVLDDEDRRILRRLIGR